MTSKESYKYRRIIVKAGTNILTGGSDELDEVFIENLVSQISDLSEIGKGALKANNGLRKIIQTLELLKKTRESFEYLSYKSSNKSNSEDMNRKKNSAEMRNNVISP